MRNPEAITNYSKLIKKQDSLLMELSLTKRIRENEKSQWQGDKIWYIRADNSNPIEKHDHVQTIKTDSYIWDEDDRKIVLNFLAMVSRKYPNPHWEEVSIVDSSDQANKPYIMVYESKKKRNNMNDAQSGMYMFDKEVKTLFDVLVEKWSMQNYRTKLIGKQTKGGKKTTAKKVAPQKKASQEKAPQKQAKPSKHITKTGVTK